MLQYLSTYFHQPAKRILKDFKSAGASNSTLITGKAMDPLMGIISLSVYEGKKTKGKN